MRSSFIRILLTAVLATGLLVTAGCGSKSDKSATYASKYKAESAQIKALGNELGTAITGASKLSDAQVATKFGGLAKRAHAAAAALLALTPPDSMKADNAALSTALNKAASDLDDIVTAAKSGDVQGAKTATVTLINDSVPVKTAREKLNAATK